MATKQTKRNSKPAKKNSTPKTKGRKVTFEFYAPSSKEVAVVGTFNSWNPTGGRLQKEKDGKWTGSFELAPGRYEYRFCVDGNWENDQRPVERVYNGLGSENCVLEV